VALAAALRADRCEIYTDVDGVYTADPRIVPEARKLERISYPEMAELAWRGAKVMHPRAIELGQLYGVDILVASSFSDSPGTLITRAAEVAPMENVRTISGIAQDLDVAKVTVADVPAGTETLAALFGPLAEAEISVDVIVVESTGDDRGRSDVSFTVAEKDLGSVEPIVRKAAAGLGAGGVTLSGGLAKVSIVGTGMLNRPGYAARMFRTLAGAKLEVQMVTTSEIQVTCVLARESVEEAVRRLHRAFGLGQPA
jgi:aspartate kinase